MPESRLLTRATLRQHLGNMPWGGVIALIEDGQLPAPLWGVDAADKGARWDRRAVDLKLDSASNIPGSVEHDTAIMDRALGLRG